MKFWLFKKWLQSKLSKWTNFTFITKIHMGSHNYLYLVTNYCRSRVLECSDISTILHITYIFPHFPGPSTYKARRSKSLFGVLESGRRGGLMTWAAACCQHLFHWCVPSVPSEAAIVSPNTTCPWPRFCFITSPADLLITCTTYRGASTCVCQHSDPQLMLLQLSQNNVCQCFKMGVYKSSSEVF